MHGTYGLITCTWRRHTRARVPCSGLGAAAARLTQRPCSHASTHPRIHAPDGRSFSLRWAPSSLRSDTRSTASRALCPGACSHSSRCSHWRGPGELRARVACADAAPVAWLTCGRALTARAPRQPVLVRGLPGHHSVGLNWGSEEMHCIPARRQWPHCWTPPLLV